MFPVLLQLGPFTLRTYGLMVALGFFVGLKYLLARARERGIAENHVLDAVLYTVVAGLAGARLMYVIVNWPVYAGHPGDIFKLWEGGLVFYGGFTAGTLAVLSYVSFHRDIPLWRFGDLIAPAVALGHFFGRLGCFFAGCCYGSASHLPWAVKYGNPLCFAPLGVPLHPVQLYEAFANLAVFFVLDRYNRRDHPEGRAFALYLFLYGAIRFAAEFLRGDERGGFAAGMSPGQLISLAAIPVAAYIFLRRRHEAHR